MPRKPVKQSVSDIDAAPGGAAAVDRALSILSVFGVETETLSLVQIAEATGLYKSTVLRLLASLEHGRLIQRLDDGRYSLGVEIARLYSAYSHSFALSEVVMPAMSRLVEVTRESASFHVRQGDQRLCLYRVDSPQPIRDHIRAGTLLPLNRGSGGRVLLAFEGEPGEPYEQIRNDKQMSSNGDRQEGVSGISSPVFDATGKLVGAITLTMPSTRFKETHKDAVLSAAKEMTQGLGGSTRLYDK
ncbi:IclR family transcriptional regulator [Herbaspirillum sp. LeCh32-8]|uniref:IclR family transcriptional regulator n=1 Tax=Herbaspirillum sp. LeCh32-8 TaxID=2821356 RepID=UPI001AE16349|nr:IclR family transcriptional regulator [Herbaspirillum sp. LeCh32-8]MBP0597740.1 IclR family transcriptional regulator [Herbaspirillum sp. LeCh32-8]